MIYCKELDKNFESHDELFKELVANKAAIISLKKAATKFSEGLPLLVAKKEDGQEKGLANLEKGYIYPVINTTKILDSHRDLHIDGLWSKTLKEQKGRIHYVVNHEFKIGTVIAYPKDLTPYTETVKWEALGKSYEGSTQALIFKFKVQDYSNKDAQIAIEKKLPVQNSISMIYKKLELAINSEDKEYKVEKAIFDTYFPQIANKDDWEELKYFWVVKEAAISREGSMVPLGSNSETPIIYPKSVEPLDNTQEEGKKAEKSLSDKNEAFLKALTEIINN